jgi:hypothetical protein
VVMTVAMTRQRADGAEGPVRLWAVLIVVAVAVPVVAAVVVVRVVVVAVAVVAAVVVVRVVVVASLVPQVEKCLGLAP